MLSEVMIWTYKSRTRSDSFRGSITTNVQGEFKIDANFEDNENERGRQAAPPPVFSGAEVPTILQDRIGYFL